LIPANVDLRLLRVFDAVVRHQGFAAAQAELNISQSTISNQITALEKRLGVSLCQRGRAGFMLTERGCVIHAEALRLFAALQDFSSAADAVRSQLVGQLRLGVVDSVVSDPQFRLPEAIAWFDRQASAVSIELVQGSPQDLQSQVIDGRIQMAIGSFPHKAQGLCYLPLYNEVNTLYCAPGHPLFRALDSQINADLLRSFRVAGRSYWRSDHPNRQHFRNTAAVAEGVEQHLMLILSGTYIGYLPDHLALPWVANGKLRQLRRDEFVYSCPFDVVIRAGKGRSALRDAFLEVLKDVYPEAKAPK